jgi:mannosyltransferase OCH1-like enzyme
MRMTKFNYNTIIPLHVYLTWKTKKLPPLMQSNLNTLKRENPRFTFHIFDDNECKEFIRRHFHPDIGKAFDTLIPGAYKADLWRLCVLYIHGGYYMDIKLKCINGFKLIELSETEHFVLDRPTHSTHIYNALMVSKPKNPFFKACIDQITQNVKLNYYGESMLSPTGPELLGKISHNFSLNIDLVYPKQFPDHIMYKGNLIIYNYPGYRQEQYNADRFHYSHLWLTKSIYKNIT